MSPTDLTTRPKEIKEYVTIDLSFAAYMLMNGAELLKAKKLGKSYKFHFDVGVVDVQKIQVSWANSESTKFDAAVRDLKKILFSGSSRE